MAMTARVKDELSRLDVTKPCCRKSEVAATLRFAGGLHIVGGRIVVEAELDTANAARRLRKNIGDLYADRAHRLARPAGPWPAPQGRERVRVRRGGGLARGVPGPWVPDGARPVVRPRGDLPWP